MTRESLLTLLLIFVALLFWRPLRRLRTVFGLDHLVSTGHVFIGLGYLIGLAIGDDALRSGTTPLAEDIAPVVAFVAGWVGFATGMRFDVRVLRTVPWHAFAAALLPAAAAALVVGGAGYAWLLASGVPTGQAIGAGLVLGAAAASSGPTLAAVIRTRRAGHAAHVRPVLRMVEFAAGVDDILVLCLALVAFALIRPAPEPLPTLGLLGLALGGGVLLGVVTWLFLGGRAKDDERMLLGLAMLAFTSGFAGWLHMSPASIAAVAAAVLVNLPGERMAQLLRAVGRVERPAVVILMIVIGLHLTGTDPRLLWPLLACMTLVRGMAKHLVGDLVAGDIPGAPGLAARKGWAAGLTSQGTFGLMVALSFYHVWHDRVAQAVLAAVAVGSMLNEIAAPWLVLRLVRRLTQAEVTRASSLGGAL